MKENEAMEKLAEAMNKLADRIEKFQDPVIWQKVIGDAVAFAPALRAMLSPLPVVDPLAKGRVEVSVTLSLEERQKLAGTVFELVKPQLAEFNEFVKQSLLDMPPHRLKEMAEKIEKGAKPSLKRRHDCVLVALDSGDEFYLGL